MTYPPSSMIHPGQGSEIPGDQVKPTTQVQILAALTEILRELKIISNEIRRQAPYVPVRDRR